MFKDFVIRRADTKTEASPSRLVSDPKPLAKSVSAVPYRKIDDSLRQYLDLKSRLHEELLGRLNLTVLDKVDRAELRREIGGLVHDFLAAENLPMRADDTERLTDELIDEVLGLGPLEPLLSDPGVADILVNSFRNV